jgi:predicted lysophospholipase L1 biosynthesis ABC-type transport system permease subunit
VNQAFVDRYWPGESGLGKRIGTREGKEEYQVVGVVADVSYRELASEPGPHLWFPLAQAYRSDLILHARTEGDPRALLPVMRRLVAELDPDLPVIRVDLMDRISANATRPQEVLSAVLGVVGLFALGLAMLGIYGVVAYSVGQRTREMGLRMALGAEPKRVMGLVLGEGVTLSLIGLVPGLLVALAASRLLRAALLGMDPLDPAAFGAGLGIMFLAVLGASLAPGIRASRADPAESLRWE